jgi:hypothetical protein
METKDPLEGKTPWEFARAWYKPDEIEHAIAGSRKPTSHFGGLPQIPSDIYSREFAEWLTDQYRLAMVKGIELGQRSQLSRMPAYDALLAACEAALHAIENADLGGEVLWVRPPHQAAAVHETASERLAAAIRLAKEGANA